MDIAFAVDAAYMEHVAVAVESILRFASTEPTRVWIIVADDVTPAQRQVLDRVVGGRANLEFLSPIARHRHGASRERHTQHVSEAMYLRLQLVDLLPATVERVLYLDADVLCVAQGLESLFELPLQGHTLGAVRDAFTRRINDHGGLPGVDRYPSIDPQDSYFNSGVLLIDTGKWRERNIRARAEQYLLQTAERRFPDQDALNVACDGDWLRLDKRWNHMMAWRLEPSNGGSLGQATVVHSAGPIKHWQQDFPDGERKQLYAELAARVLARSSRPIE